MKFKYFIKLFFRFTFIDIWNKGKFEYIIPCQKNCHGWYVQNPANSIYSIVHHPWQIHEQIFPTGVCTAAQQNTVSLRENVEADKRSRRKWNIVKFWDVPVWFWNSRNKCDAYSLSRRGGERLLFSFHPSHN